MNSIKLCLVALIAVIATIACEPYKSYDHQKGVDKEGNVYEVERKCTYWGAFCEKSSTKGVPHTDFASLEEDDEEDEDDTELASK